MDHRIATKTFPEIIEPDTWVVYETNIEASLVFYSEEKAIILFNSLAEAELYIRIDKGDHFEEKLLKKKLVNITFEM